MRRWFDYRSLEVKDAPGVETPVRVLLADAAARAILERHLPELARGAIPDFIANIPLIDLGVMAPDQFPSAKLRATAADLRELERG